MVTDPDRKYTVEVWVRRTTGNVSNLANVELRMYASSQESGGALSNDVASGARIAASDVPPNEWVKLTGTWTRPSPSDTYVSPRLTIYTRSGHPSDAATWHLGMVSMKDQAGATLIEDGAITTDKILANAITAGKIAALAIEADHISANAITADKIHAGAIDSMLITGARIRTSASGARVELNSEGLKAYRSNGAVVLNTDTSDGSIDMTGNLRQVIKGVTMSVGDNFAGVNPGISWSDTNNFATPPGVIYGEDAGARNVYLQGPGTATDFSGLKLKENGDGFNLFSQSGSHSWRINTSVSENYFRAGSSASNAPYMYFKRGSGDTGTAWIGYKHPTNGGFASMALEDRGIFLGTSDSNGNVVSRLWGDADSTELTAGSRPITIRGEDYAVLHGRDSVGPWTQMQGVANRTMSGFSKVIVAPNGTMGAEGSSRRFKVNIEYGKDGQLRGRTAVD